jgi:hypothetical protein
MKQKQSHLSTRDWVVQEEILSCRTLHCLKSEVYWHCNGFFKTQSGEISHPMDVLCDASDEPYTNEKRSWYYWVSIYLKRDFTFLRDRIVAIAGISSYHQQISRHTPLLGS